MLWHRWGGDLYVGGLFSTAGGNNAKGIAKWNGSSWSALGSGTYGGVLALAPSGPDLFVGGYFETAGSKPSEFIASARIASFVKSLTASNSTASMAFSGVTGYQYDIQRAATLNAPLTWSNLTTTPLSPASDGSFSFADTNAPHGAAYYRT